MSSESLRATLKRIIDAWDVEYYEFNGAFLLRISGKESTEDISVDLGYDSSSEILRSVIEKELNQTSWYIKS